MKIKTFQYLKEIGIDLWVMRPPLGNNPEELKACFLFLNYHSVGFCCSLDPENQRTPPDVLRFLDDLAFVFSLRKLSPYIGQLYWPLPFNPDCGLQEVIGQIVSALPEKVILFGERFANCMSDMEDEIAEIDYKRDTKQFLFAGDIFAYLGNPQAKKDLWVKLCDEGLINGDLSVKS